MSDRKHCDGCRAAGIHNDLTGRPDAFATVQLGSVSSKRIDLCFDRCYTHYESMRSEIDKLEAESAKRFEKDVAQLIEAFWQRVGDRDSSQTNAA